MTLTQYDAFSMTRLAPTDEIQEAVIAWKEGQVGLFAFCELANSIVGKRDGGTAKLAAKIKRSVDTVESYAAAGALWLALLQHFPAETETYREELDVAFWTEVGAMLKSDVKHIVKKYEIKDGENFPVEALAELTQAVKRAKDWMDLAMKKNMTVESFRAMLPVKRVGESPFTRSLRKIATVIEKDILNAPALDSGMTDKEYKLFIKVATWLHKFITGKVEVYR